ncbi:branched-chain amino acid permease (azaleucine resistance) [Afipia sp. P52-10]|uniref:AzlC family ABC transporter permease n=1 Tax=Afipia sp. P52-10 TaxID=1429916 RepID=UPI0003DF21A1|nr:AzlC family ABC transporter permease [Afipia sp. P52-10]ETR75473.1 branched-chain amino acid permease (azaleucine resistance) [Afipia sp. P52-10]
MQTDPTATLSTGGNWATSLGAFTRGVAAAYRTILTYTLFATYLGVGALAHDLGFSLLWALLGTTLVWAAPAQMILLTALGGSGTVVQAAIAVTLSAIRLMPMVVSLLPMLRGPKTRAWHLILPTHFIAVTVWVESMRLVPGIPRERRVAFVNGLGCGVMLSTVVSTIAGYTLAAALPPLFGAAVLFLTPISFLLTTATNSKQLVDRLALGLGLGLMPLAAFLNTGIDMLIAGVSAGTIAYGVHRLRRVP